LWISIIFLPLIGQLYLLFAPKGDEGKILKILTYGFIIIIFIGIASAIFLPKVAKHNVDTNMTIQSSQTQINK